MAKAKPAQTPNPVISTGAESTTVKIDDTYSEEKIIALCGPVGAPLIKVAESLQNSLTETYNFKCEILRLSDYISEYNSDIPTEPEFDRIQKSIDRGNEMRQEFGNSVLAELAIKDIAFKRKVAQTEKEEKRFTPQRVCYIINSIKNDEELTLLRQIYRENFFQIGVYASKSQRVENLKRLKIKEKNIYELIDRDSGEEFAHGQSVRNTFPESDFFLRADSYNDKDITNKVKRFLRLLFDNTETPRTEEMAMYAASSAAVNSACLSRRVGASIMSPEGQVVSTGWNDVPQPQGGLYKTESNDSAGEDNRCMYFEGFCHNDQEKDLLANTIVDALKEEGVIKEADRQRAKIAVKKSKIKDLIEFSRAVHAEMFAIIQASHTADNLSGSTLFCTTYPCHSCARHIIAAGITTVYYIEPYRKSLATRLHGDAITENSDEIGTGKVRILMYEGVAPGRYMELFELNGSRKNKSGKVIQESSSLKKPKTMVSLESIPHLESIIVQELVDKKLLNVGMENGEAETNR